MALTSTLKLYAGSSSASPNMNERVWNHRYDANP